MKKVSKNEFEKCKKPSEFLKVWLDGNFLRPEAKKIFNSYYFSFIRNFDTRMQANYDAQMNEIMEEIKTKRNVLEIGCGCGSESLWMALNKANVYGIDISEDKIKVCNERKKILEKITSKTLNCTFENVPLFDFKTDKKFDVIWIEQAFHHVEPRENFFDRAFELLNKNGMIVFSESNAWNPLIQLGLFKRRGFKTLINSEVNGKTILIGNERIITPLALKRWLKKKGFSVKLVKYFRLFPNKKKFKKFTSFERNFPQFVKFVFTHYNLVAQKNRDSLD